MLAFRKFRHTVERSQEFTYLTNLVFSVRTLSYGSSFFPVDLWPESCRSRLSNSVYCSFPVIHCHCCNWDKTAVLVSFASLPSRNCEFVSEEIPMYIVILTHYNCVITYWGVSCNAMSSCDDPIAFYQRPTADMASLVPERNHPRPGMRCGIFAIHNSLGQAAFAHSTFYHDQ